MELYIANAYPDFEHIRKVHSQYHDLDMKYWLHHDLFSLQWWLLLFILIVPWIYWIRVVDQKNLASISIYGLLIMLISCLLDVVGTECHLWAYSFKLQPFIPMLLSVDLGSLAVVHMLIFQRFKSWNSFMIANTVVALIFGFLLEPITVWIGIYKTEHWEYVYSLPIYIMKAIFGKWVTGIIISRNRH